MRKCESVIHSVMPDSLPHRLYPVRLLCSWGFPGNNTGVDSHSLLQGTFRTQGLNPVSCVADRLFAVFTQSCLTLCDSMDYIVHRILQARILEWVANTFSRGSSQPRDQTQVSCIAGVFFTKWATREAQSSSSSYLLLMHAIWNTLGLFQMVAFLSLAEKQGNFFFFLLLH